jgi:ribosomal protein L11 methyltransferase
VIVGGEPELALLLHILPEGVEELDGGYAVYSEEPPLGFDLVAVDDVEEGWEDRWRAFHHGVRAGRLWVGPPWEEAPPDATPVVIDPGRAFGTGAHPTTHLCLELLQELERGSLVDLGCGSGVVAIAAARLGFAPVTAVDSDEAAIEATERNAAANGVAVEARLVDLRAEPAPAADVAVANIDLGTIELLRPDSSSVVTSGYYAADLPELDGFRRADRRVREGWAADLFRRE